MQANPQIANEHINASAYIDIVISKSSIAVLDQVVGHGHVEIGGNACIGVVDTVGLASEEQWANEPQSLMHASVMHVPEHLPGQPSHRGSARCGKENPIQTKPHAQTRNHRSNSCMREVSRQVCMCG